MRLRRFVVCLCLPHLRTLHSLMFLTLVNSCFLFPQSLIAAFKGTWKKVPFKDGAPLHVIYAWFNKALLKSGMSGWSPEGKRWTYLQYKLGLSDGSAGWVLLHSSPYSNESPMRSVHSPFRAVSPILHLANV